MSKSRYNYEELYSYKSCLKEFVNKYGDLHDEKYFKYIVNGLTENAQEHVKWYNRCLKKANVREKKSMEVFEAKITKTILFAFLFCKHQPIRTKKVPHCNEMFALRYLEMHYENKGYVFQASKDKQDQRDAFIETKEDLVYGHAVDIKYFIRFSGHFGNPEDVKWVSNYKNK